MKSCFDQPVGMVCCISHQDTPMTAYIKKTVHVFVTTISTALVSLPDCSHIIGLKENYLPLAVLDHGGSKLLWVVTNNGDCSAVFGQVSLVSIDTLVASANSRNAYFQNINGECCTGRTYFNSWQLHYKASMKRTWCKLLRLAPESCKVLASGGRTDVSSFCSGLPRQCRPTTSVLTKTATSCSKRQADGTCTFYQLL